MISGREQTESSTQEGGRDSRGGLGVDEVPHAFRQRAGRQGNSRLIGRALTPYRQSPHALSAEPSRLIGRALTPYRLGLHALSARPSRLIG